MTAASRDPHKVQSELEASEEYQAPPREQEQDVDGTAALGCRRSGRSDFARSAARKANRRCRRPGLVQPLPLRTRYRTRMNWPTPPTLAPRRQESGCSRSPKENALVAVLVVLCGAFDHGHPRLPAPHPDLGLGRQAERCIVERPDPNLNQPIRLLDRIENPRTAGGAKTAPLVVDDLAAQLEVLDRPLRVDRERTARFPPTVVAVTTANMHCIAANAVSD